MNEQSSLVSVLICAYNCEKYISDTIKSVQSQKYKNLEILILDNNSRDKTYDILKQLASKDCRIKIFKEKRNLGAYGGLNYLLDKTRGEFVAIQDHDDLWHSDKILKQLEFLNNNKKYIGCGTGYIRYFENSNKFIIEKRPQIDYYGWHPSLIFRNISGKYDTSIASYTDYHFVRYILAKNKKVIYNLNEPYSLHRMRDDYKNLGNKWLKLTNIKNAISLDNKSALDKLWFLYGALIPKRIIYFLSFNVFSRSKYKNISILNNNKITSEYLKYIDQNE